MPRTTCNMSDLIILKNSNALFKYPVDAEQLNRNFKILEANSGGKAIEDFVNSSGQVYNPEIENQLASAVAQYVLCSGIFDDVSTTDHYQLEGRDGMVSPSVYKDGMTVTFKPKHTNSGPSTLQIGTMKPYPIRIAGTDITAGYMLPNTYMSFIFTKVDGGETTTYYWNPVASTAGSSSSSSSSGSSSESSSSSSQTANYAGVAIRRVIQSAGLDYAESDTNLLGNAISTYVAGSCYGATYNGDTYSLTTRQSQFAPKDYFEGMVVSFIVPESNTTETVKIRLGVMSAVEVKNTIGADLGKNTLATDEFVTLIYSNGYFKLITQFKPRIQFSDMSVLDGIVNDPTLPTDSTTKAVTEHAVRNFVESKMKSKIGNTIVSGYTDDQNRPAALKADGTHRLTLIAGEQCFVSNTPNDPADVIVSSTSANANKVSLIDLNPNTYWETSRTGFLIDDRKRMVAGAEGNYYITFDYSYNNDNETDQYNTTPPSPEWFGFKNFTKLPDALKIKFTDAEHTPIQIIFQVCLTNYDSTSDIWYDLVNVTDSGVDPEDGEPYTITDSDYGIIENLEQDDDGYYRILVPTYYTPGPLTPASDDTGVRPVPETGIKALRVYVREFNQEVTTKEINTPGYNPNAPVQNANPMQVVDCQCGSIIDAENFGYTFPNADVGEERKPLFYSQYGEDDESDYSVLDIIPDGQYSVYIDASDPGLHIVNKNKVFKQSYAPDLIEENENGVWYETTSEFPNTYRCVETTSEDPDVRVFEWQKTNIMLVGMATFYNNKVSAIKNYAYGVNVIVDYDALATMTQTIEHNFGQSVSVGCSLYCISPDLGYSVGDVIDIIQNTYYKTSMEETEVVKDVVNESDVVIGTTTVKEYNLVTTPVIFSASSDTMTAQVKLVNFELPHKTNATTAPISSGCWKLKVLVAKG